MKKSLFCILLIALNLIFSGCASTFAVKEEADNSVSFTFSAELGDVLIDTVKEAAKGFGTYFSSEESSTSESIVLFDTEKIKVALEKEGFSDVSVSSLSFSNININAKGELYELLSKEMGFLSLHLSSENIRLSSARLGEETQNFLNLLMAPIFSGEEMTAQEYTDLIALVYGNEILHEIQEAKIIFVLSNASGKEKRFSLPLSDFLTLKGEKIFSLGD